MSYLRVLARLSWYAFTRLWDRAKADCGYLLALGNTKSQVLQTVDGQRSLGARACVFVHFDPNGVVHEHTRFYLQALAEQGISVIFVTNSGYLADESRAYVQRWCNRILIRKNRGYDFGGYRDGILSLGIEPGKFTSLIIANDSVYGPITTLSALLSQLDFTSVEIWGATDSWQHKYHLQTYFIAFGPKAMVHPAFTEFWCNVRNVRSKAAAVRYYELELTQWFQAAGLRCRAVWDYHALLHSAQSLAQEEGLLDRKPPAVVPTMKQIANLALSAASVRKALNPTCELWLLLLWHGCPFIKRELLQLNPTRVPSLFVWHRVVLDCAPELYQMIMDDLRRVARQIAP